MNSNIISATKPQTTVPPYPKLSDDTRQAQIKLVKLIEKQKLIGNSKKKQDRKAYHNIEAEKTYLIQYLAKSIPPDELAKPEFEDIKRLVNFISEDPAFDAFEKDFEAAMAYKGKKIFCLPVLEIIKCHRKGNEYFVTVFFHAGFLDFPPKSTQTFSLRYLFSIGCRLISDEKYNFLTANAVVEKEVEVIKKVTETKIVTQGGGKINKAKFDKAFDNTFHDIKKQLGYNPTPTDLKAFELMKDLLHQRIGS